MSDVRELLDVLRTAVDAGEPPDLASRALLSEVDDPAVLRKAGKILAAMPVDDGELRPVRVAVLGTATLGPYEALLRAVLVAAGAAPVIQAGEYGRFELALASAELTGETTEQDKPDVVSCVLDDAYFVPDDWDADDVDGLCRHLRDRFETLRGLLASAIAAGPASFVLHTVPLPAQLRDSLIGWRDRARLARAWYALNAGLCGLADEYPQIAVADLVGALGDAGVRARDDRLYRYGDLPYTDAALLVLAQQVRRFVQARLGLSRKVLALDLDDTLWGGVLGEVGPGGVQLGGLYPGNCYLELQRTAVRLHAQGVVLVLVSKNDAEPVERALAEHPEMLLRGEAFSATAVNWAPKAGNLRAAAATLGLSTGAFVLLDDSPFERGHVRAELPEVAVLASDGDPAHLVRTLLAHGWFDVPELTRTDRERPKLYRTKALRSEFEGGFGSSEEYLRALELELTAEPANEFSVGRLAQLAARTNQFNLTGRRFDEARTTEMAADPDHLVAGFSTRDRFGDDGIVGAAWMRREDGTWHVDNLVLSCRVLGRGVELAIAGWLARRARAAGARTVEAEFVPSPKNAVAADFWTRAGFRDTGSGHFRLDPGAEVPEPDWIAVHDAS